MNLVTLITGIVIAMAVVELLLQGMPKLKRDLFYLAMLVAWAGFTAKYYYGPDIAAYAVQYSELGNIPQFFCGHYPQGYELGYVFFVTVCNTFGLDFWGMTAVVSTMFFYVVFIILSRLKDKRVLALALVLVVMKDLIYAQLRQCLAVTFFAFAILEAEGWKRSGYRRNADMLWAIVLGLVAITMHKSGMFVITLSAIYYTLQRSTISKNSWNILLVVLMLMLVIPTWDIIEYMVQSVDFGRGAMRSIQLHFSYMRLVQTNLLIYGTVLIVLAMYTRSLTGKSAIVATALIGMIIIVILYQYYYMVNRLRSYFVLFIIYYAFNVMHEAAEEKAPFAVLVRQTFEIVLILFMVGKTYSFDKNMRIENGDLLDSCTVFDLLDEDAQAIQKRQMEKAERFWDAGVRTDQQYAIPDKK